ncbi:hypothetical protein QA860_08150 [Streptomyces stelliscabiei]|uniref:hypothetical protein n=1 Tax=Streptomyces stelliscabiei TaxID=146820 RepID=UPI002FF18C3B
MRNTVTTDPQTATPEPFPIWVVWREDQPAHGYFATEDIAKQATIDCWEEDEPVCPDYSWRRDGPRWELVVGGEHGGVYASRHLVYGGAPAAAVPVAAPPTTGQAEARCAVCRRPGDGSHPAVCFPPAPAGRAATLREAAARYEEILANADTGQDPRYWTAVRDITLGLRAMAVEAELAGGPSRVAAETPHTETPDAEELAARLEAALTERFTALGNPFSEMRRQEQGPDGWPASRPVGPHQVAEVLRELLTTAPAVVAQPGKETSS